MLKHDTCLHPQTLGPADVSWLLQAIQVMREQGSRGHIFNMDGAGADGNATPLFSAYGATKRGLAQLGKSLQVRTGLVEVVQHQLQLYTGSKECCSHEGVRLGQPRGLQVEIPQGSPHESMGAAQRCSLHLV